MRAWITSPAARPSSERRLRSISCLLRSGSACRCSSSSPRMLAAHATRAYYQLARTWAKGMAILFAVGAVSGTILSFELGLLWPNFMRYAGGVIGLPFSYEGFAFFIEAIFVRHLLVWLGEAVATRAFLVRHPDRDQRRGIGRVHHLRQHAWMQMPTGFRLEHSPRRGRAAARRDVSTAVEGRDAARHDRGVRIQRLCVRGRLRRRAVARRPPARRPGRTRRRDGRRCGRGRAADRLRRHQPRASTPSTSP